MRRFIDLHLSLQGRTSRHDYWLYWVLPSAVIIWPGIAVSVRRWHDIDVSGWWALIGLVPYVRWIILLVFNGFGRGTMGRNRFGPDPIRDFPSTDSEVL